MGTFGNVGCEMMVIEKVMKRSFYCSIDIYDLCKKYKNRPELKELFEHQGSV